MTALEISDAARLLDSLASVRRALGSEVAVDDEAISTMQFFALRSLVDRDRTVSDLARAMGVQLSTLTQLVDSLVARRWVQRYDDPSDRRRVCLTLTPAGHELYARARHAAEERMARLLERMTLPERRALLRGLEALRAAMQRPSVGASGQGLGRGKAQ